MVSISLNCPEIADISLAILFFVKQVTESVLFKRLCPNILSAASRGIPFSEAIVVANVRRAEKVVTGWGLSIAKQIANSTDSSAEI